MFWTLENLHSKLITFDQSGEKKNTCLAAIGGGNSGLSPILLLLLLLAEALAIADVFSGKFPNCTKALLLGGPKM